jgi:phosphoribosylformylglycinamidine synthase
MKSEIDWQALKGRNLLIFIALGLKILKKVVTLRRHSTQSFTHLLFMATGKEIAKQLGLLPEEYDKIVGIMGREPNFTELSIFSVMWSEHCSYKNSIVWLKTLPRDGERLLVGAGEENAGLVDIGDGWACAFKIESHNHPSCIEPYQGAATGVGGIHRDIFTMGARPIAALNSLRFGDLSRPQMRRLVKGVVSGIGGYGNAFGVPTVGGEVYFHPCYNQNILVNAMSVGIVKVGETISACADGPGNPVFIVGSSTGKDGIHGATFASADLTEDSAEDLPAVQVGDPFQEKLLLEATLEVIKTGAVVGMQDMGAAGITCSTSEMSAKSNTGMRIDLDKVPTRQANMKDWEILLSESQERMLIVAKKGEEHKILEVFEKWDLQCAEIGVVTDTKHVEFYHNGQLVANVPAEPLVLGGGAPQYNRDETRPTYLDKVAAFDASKIQVPADLKAVAQKLAGALNIASKRWISEQYDSMVRTNTLSTNLPSDSAVIRLKGSNKALLANTDCNPMYVYADPNKGAQIAVAEAARNIVCSGGMPLAVTNNLNFGNPYSPEVYWQFVESVKGMGEACRVFGTPVTGGNVSFYNQSVINGETLPVYPTPTIGMLGLMNDVSKRLGLGFRKEGDAIYLLGNSHNCIGSSEYIRQVHEVEYSNCPHFDINEELTLHKTIVAAHEAEFLASAHDLSEGGLFIALMESAFAANLGFEVTYSTTERADAFWFGEAQSRAVVSVSTENAAAFEALCGQHGQSVHKLGSVKGQSLVINSENWGTLEDWRKPYNSALETAVEA